MKATRSKTAAITTSRLLNEKFTTVSLNEKTNCYSKHKKLFPKPTPQQFQRLKIRFAQCWFLRQVYIVYIRFFCGVGAMVEIKGRKFTVILREEPEGGYSAQCLELSGAISEGDNRKEAINNIKEAIEGYLEAFPEELDQLKRKKELVKITV